MDEVEAEAGKDRDPNSVVGRPHIAAILNRKGYVSSIKQAFDKYLAPGGLAYFDKERLTPRRALEMIHESGGLPVLAHPVQLRTQNDAELERVVKDLADMGLSGLEIIHSDHTPELTEKYTRLADRFALLKTGGSDFHGSNKKDIDLGTAKGRRVPRELMDRLVERHAAVQSQRVNA
jgi:predicted metal-dependent phosphoesterase TrpH